MIMVDGCWELTNYLNAKRSLPLNIGGNVLAQKWLQLNVGYYCWYRSMPQYLGA